MAVVDRCLPGGGLVERCVVGIRVKSISANSYSAGSRFETEADHEPFNLVVACTKNAPSLLADGVCFTSGAKG